jgi:peptidoglycan glycosyltransferase
VVTREKGTGRRAEVEGVTLALKTGTAGARENGYDALIVAFAPADQPKIAFALIAENAGSAELAAAKAAHDFVAGLRASGHL